MKAGIKKFIVFIIQSLMNNPNTVGIINFLFENLNWKFKDFIMRNLKMPARECTWYFKLLNGKKIVTRVRPDFPNSWHFATSYIWHDTGLTYAEYYLNEFYPVSHASLDIGANIGFRSLYASSKGRKSILFEPNSNLHDFIRETYKSNQLTMDLQGVCLSDHSGKARFYLSSSSYLSSLEKENAAADKIVQEIDVDLITLDNFIAGQQNVIPSIIKIDVEGHEYPVLLGAVKTIEKYSPSFLIEILADKVKKEQIFSFFRERDYKIIAINDLRQPYLVENYRDDVHYSFNFLFVKNPELLSYLRQKGSVK